MLSIDGFAAHYLQMYQPKNIQALAKKGVVSRGLEPSFPTKTFPNHLTLVTGKVPFEHGIVLNRFYDKKANDIYKYGKSKTKHQWLKAPPIWTLLEQRNIPTAIYFWPESENSYQGKLPTYYKKYNDNTSNQERFDQMFKWLKMSGKSKPKLILGYFSSIDSAGHHYGRNSPELAHAIYTLDKQLGEFVDNISTLTNTPVNIILVSDHGMVQTKPENIVIPKNIVPEWMFEEFKVIFDSTQVFIYGNDQILLNKAYKELSSAHANHLKNRLSYDIFNKNNFPEYWKIDGENSFSPDIVLSAIPPSSFNKNEHSNMVETHGFETKYTTDLNGLFIAYGPSFKSHQQLPVFNNTAVFSMLSRIFALTPEDKAKEYSQILNKVFQNK